MPVPYVPPSDGESPGAQPPAPAPALRGLFGELPPPPAFGTPAEQAPAADAWRPQVAAPLQPRTPRWYRPNPYGFAWAALWSLPLPVLGAARLGGELSAYLVGAFVGAWCLSTVVVGAAAYFSTRRWRWWLAYPVGVVLVGLLRVLVGSVLGASP